MAKPVLKIFKDTSGVTYGYELLDSNGDVFLMSDGYTTKENIISEMEQFEELLSNKDVRITDKQKE